MTLDVFTLAAVAKNLDAEAAVYLRRAALYARKLSDHPEESEEWWAIHEEVKANTLAGQALHEASEGLLTVIEGSKDPRINRLG